MLDWRPELDFCTQCKLHTSFLLVMHRPAQSAQAFDVRLWTFLMLSVLSESTTHLHLYLLMFDVAWHASSVCMLLSRAGVLASDPWICCIMQGPLGSLLLLKRDHWLLLWVLLNADDVQNPQ